MFSFVAFEHLHFLLVSVSSVMICFCHTSCLAVLLMLVLVFKLNDGFFICFLFYITKIYRDSNDVVQLFVYIAK